MNKFLTCFLFCGLILNLQSQSSFCLQISEVSNDGESLVVSLDMQGDGELALGSSNLQFSYSQSNLGDPSLISTPLAPPIYFAPTLTTPNPGEASLNIELAFPGTGLDVSSATDYTSVAQISFPIIGPVVGEIAWTYNGGTCFSNRRRCLYRSRADWRGWSTIRLF